MLEFEIWLVWEFFFYVRLDRYLMHNWEDDTTRGNFPVKLLAIAHDEDSEKFHERFLCLLLSSWNEFNLLYNLYICTSVHLHANGSSLEDHGKLKKVLPRTFKGELIVYFA